MLGYCKKCHSAVFVENVSENRKYAELSCLGCGKRKFVEFKHIQTIAKAKGIDLRL